MSESFFEKEMSIYLSEDASPISFAHKRGREQPGGHLLHLNNHIEIYVYVSGETDYIVEDKYITLEHGDSIVILPHEVHVPVLRSECVYERFYMLIPLNSFSNFPFDPFAHFCAVKGHKISLSQGKKEKLLSLLYQISELSGAENTPSAKMAATGLFLQIQGILISGEDLGCTHSDVEIPSELPDSLREILKYIGLYAQDIPSVEAVARHFYISPQYLSSLFKKYVGVNVNHYLRIKKTALAKRLLEKGSSVAEACYACGFSDSSHFIKNFKRFVGMTPKQYKDLFLKKTL